MYMPGWRQTLSASIRVRAGRLRGGARSRLCARDVRVHFPEPPHCLMEEGHWGSVR